jgi:4-amino-4-deoxy-L-arabinose transferase-like glycosyltransferase
MKLFLQIEKASNTNLMMFVFIVALFVRMVYAIYGYYADVMADFSDDIAYMHFAEQINIQGFFVPDLEQLGTYAGVVGPVIGWLLAIPYFFFGENWLAIFVQNAIVGSISCVLLYLLVIKLTNNSKIIAFASAFYFSFYVLVFRFTATGGKEIWMIFFLLMNIYFFILYYQSHLVWKNVVWLALLFATILLLDERFLFYSPIIVLALLLFPREIALSHRVKKACLFSFLVLIFLLPWHIRNYIAYDRIILVSVRTNTITEKIFGYEPKEYFDADYKKRWYISPERYDSVIAGKTNLFDNGLPISAKQIQAMKEGRLPGDFTYRQTIKASFLNFWQPFLFKGRYYHDGHRFISLSVHHNITLLIFYTWLLIFFPVGIFFLFKKQKISFWLVAITIFVYVMIHVILIPFTSYRYRLPIEPLIVFTSLSGIIELIKQWKRFTFKTL